MKAHDIPKAIREELAKASALHGVHFRAGSVDVNEWGASAYIHCGSECATGDTLAEAAKNLAAKLSKPDDLVKEKRATAARLLAEAEALEGGAK